MCNLNRIFFEVKLLSSQIRGTVRIKFTFNYMLNIELLIFIE